MSSDSTIYTIGTALNRARDNQVPVQLLVEGQWLGGEVLAVDGFGVVLQSEELQHSVVRMESITAVQIFSQSPIRRTPIEAVARPMPGPRQSWD